MRALTVGLLATVLFHGCKKQEVAVVPPPPPPVVEKPRPVEPPVATPTQGKLELSVTDDGFVPDRIRVKANEPLTLRIERKTDETCATEILIDGTDINVKLPLNEPVEVAWTPTKTGAVKFGCAMDKMVGGVLLVE